MKGCYHSKPGSRQFFELETVLTVLKELFHLLRKTLFLLILNKDRALKKNHCILDFHKLFFERQSSATEAIQITDVLLSYCDAEITRRHSKELFNFNINCIYSYAGN